MRSEPPTGDELAKLLVTMKRNVLEQVEQEPAQEPARRRAANRGLIFGVGLTALLGIGAGAAFAFGVATSNDAAEPAPQQLAPIASPTPDPAVTATPTPTPVYEVTPGQPASRYGLDCDTLVDPALVSALFSTPVESADPIATATRAGNSIPRRTAILAVGGTVCEWSNGVAMNTQYEVAPEYVGVTISVTPRPAAGWTSLGSIYLAPENAISSCWSDAATCSASVEVNDAWVTLEATGADSAAIEPARWQRLRDAVVGTATAAGFASPPSFTEFSGIFTTAEECEALLPLESVLAISGLPDATFGDERGGWSDWAEARSMLGSVQCSWGTHLESAAGLDISPGSRWAYLRMLRAGDTTPVDIPGLASGDQAVTRCDDAYGVCAVDLAVDDDWVHVSARDATTAAALAEALLPRLYE